jgi:hypothetical protein
MDGTECVKLEKFHKTLVEMKASGNEIDCKSFYLSLIDEARMEEVHAKRAPFQEDAKSHL